MLHAKLVPAPEIATLAGQRVLAFAGIAMPDKFFAMLREAGIVLAGSVPFPDHHAFGERDLRRLAADAARLDAIPVTTPKDAVRLPAAFRDVVRVVGVTLAWDDPAKLEALLARYA
jgi:tetraacyldisaccharide 4'-kinase